MHLQSYTRRVGILAVAASSLAHAGEMSMGQAPIAMEPHSPTGCCDALQSIGKLYKNSDNPLFQEFKVFGRFQYQTAYVAGDDVNGDSYDERIDEYRRVRVGVSSKFLQFFDVKANINLVSDGRPGGGELDWGYDSFDEALIGVNLQKVFGLDGVDKLKLTYGRSKFDIGFEAIESSKKILTVERSALSNKIYGSDRPTGFELHGAKGPWSGLLALYSTEVDDEFLAGWGESLAYQARLGYQVSDELKVTADFVYNDSDSSDDSYAWDYHWATALTAQYQNDRFGLAVEGVYGDNGDEDQNNSNPDRQGQFWGLIVEPSYWLVEDRLQGVVRYQYQGSSEDEGIRLNSRYVRRSGDRNGDVDVNGGRADFHQSLYAGLNYHICDHNAKVMAGIEYDDFDTPAGDSDALTYWLAVRTYF